MIALDVSSSMLAEDFAPNRLGAAKETVARFVDARTHDRIGLVAFAAEALTQVPATGDHAILGQAIDNVQVGMLEDGTAIGLGLATAANRLEAGRRAVARDHPDERRREQPRLGGPARGGEGRRGVRHPRLHHRGGVADARPHSRGDHGRRARCATPGCRVSIDEPLLNDIARTTGGRYFRATDQRALERVYAEIDRLVKTKVQRAPLRALHRALPAVPARRRGAAGGRVVLPRHALGEGAMSLRIDRHLPSLQLPTKVDEALTSARRGCHPEGGHAGPAVTLTAAARRIYDRGCVTAGTPRRDARASSGLPPSSHRERVVVGNDGHAFARLRQTYCGGCYGSFGRRPIAVWVRGSRGGGAQDDRSLFIGLSITVVRLARGR